ncbi:ATP synthase subunit I [Pasteurellaceae bacterium LIM206]|nr:ATP synthase subunit I [Pasteurellaceae bacterium LIM206]
MSLVLANARKVYKKAFATEVMLLLISSVFVYVFFYEQISSFLLGALIALLPQISFIGYALYVKHNEPIENKAKVLYQSEGLKLVLTVGFFGLVFVCFTPKPAGLFLGYFLFIVLNNLLPALLNIKSTR